MSLYKVYKKPLDFIADIEITEIRMDKMIDIERKL